GFGQMPGIKQPTLVAQSQGLPRGAWYYRVAAVGPWGESLASREVVALGASGQIKLCWQPPTTIGAVSYNIYRSLAADGHVGSAAAIGYEGNPADHCWTDPGSGAHAPAPGTARGTPAGGGAVAAGAYSYRVAAVVPTTGGTRETYAGYAATITVAAADVTAGNQTIDLAWDGLPITGASY